MLASRSIRQGALPSTARSAPFWARALHVSSGPKFRPALAPLHRIRRPHAIRPGQLAPSLTAVRFNSTTPSPVNPATTTPPPTSSAFLDNLDSIGAAAEVPPNTMGYLHSLGVDYGWGTTSVIQTMLESLHVYTGLPWWGTILSAVVIVRLLQFPGYCKLSSMTARMKEVNPLVAPLAEKMKDAQRRGATQEMLQTRAEMTHFFRTAGVQRAWLFFPFTQIPVFYGFYKILRGMAEVPVPALTTDGLGWFTDLSMADPTYILPATASAFIALQIATGGEAGATTMAKSMKTGLMVALPMLSFAVTCNWPAALSLYIMSNSALGVAQSLLLKNEHVRERLGLYPLNVGGSKNPLAPRTPHPKLNIVRPAAPEPKTINVIPNKKQWGSQGGLLDRLTGGADDKNSAWSIKNWKDSMAKNTKEKKYQAYEARRKKQIDEQKKAEQLESERRLRMRQTKP